MNYFENQYRQDKFEIESIDRLLNGVWKTLANCIAQNGYWPYDISADESISVARMSVSTQAMVHFSLEIARRGLPFHKFGCRKPSGYRVPKAPALDKQTLKDIDSAIKVSREKLRSINDIRGEIAMGTFGELNPVTLSWLIPITSLYESADDLFALANESLNRAKRLPDGAISILQLNNVYEVSTHAFPVLRALQLYRMLEDAKKSISPEAQNTFSFGSLGEWFYSRLLDHLAFATIKDGPFDAAELAFSLEGYLLCRPQLADGCNHDRDAIDRTFEVLERRQEITPYWRPLKPLLTNKKGFALLPLSVEIVNSLFRSCWILGTRGDSLFSKHIQIFHHYYQWIESRVTGGRFFTSLDRKVEKNFLGWHSEHLAVKDGIHTWETSQVGIYLIHYRSMLQRHVAAECISATNLKIERSMSATANDDQKHPSLAVFWKKEFQEKFSPRPSDPNDVYAQIGKYFIGPRDGVTCNNDDQSEAHYSMVLYGPPGTGKTTIAKAVAKALGWDFISLSPSDFVQTGVSQVEQRAKRIFEALTEQENCVILLDEIDRLILDRNLKAYVNQDDMFQMMTPSMLPKLKDLREREASIFVIATNYFERIERAAIRAGRVDDALLVGLPDFEARRAIIFSQFLSQAQKVTPQLKSRKEQALAKLTECQSSIEASIETQTQIQNLIDIIDDIISKPGDTFRDVVHSLAEMSPLASFSELKQLVQRTVNEISENIIQHCRKLLSGNDVTSYLKQFDATTLDFNSCFTNHLKRMTFDVRLSNYKSRVISEGKSDAVSGGHTSLETPPTEELLDVIWLKVEKSCSNLSNDDKDLIQRLLTGLMKRISEVDVSESNLTSVFEEYSTKDQVFLRMERQVKAIIEYLKKRMN